MKNKTARAIRTASDSVLFVESYDETKRWATSDQSRADGYEVLHNNGKYNLHGIVL